MENTTEDQKYTTEQVLDMFNQIAIDLINTNNNEKRGIVQINVDLDDLTAAKQKYLQAQSEVPDGHGAKIGHSLDKLSIFLRDALGPVWENPAQYNKSLNATPAAAPVIEVDAA